VIFGSGKEGWHAATPKGKYVLVNVPFDTLEVGRMLISKKKPPIFVIKALEAQIMDSAVWWEARKTLALGAWRYRSIMAKRGDFKDRSCAEAAEATIQGAK